MSTHAVAYRMVEADHAARHALLDHTGHTRLWPWVAALGVSAGVAALVAFTTRAVSEVNGRPVSVWRLARRLAVLQGGGWLALEAVERVAFAPDVHALVDLPMLVGLFVQAVVAVVAALVLHGLTRVVELLRRRRGPGWRPTRRRLPSPAAFIPSWPMPTPASPRGPPIA